MRAALLHWLRLPLVMNLALLLLCLGVSVGNVRSARHASYRGGPTSRWSSSSSTSGKRYVKAISATQAKSNQRHDVIFSLRGGSGHSLFTSSRANVIAVSLTDFAKSHPILTAFLTCGVNGAAADWIAQKSEAMQRARRDISTTTTLSIRPSGAAFIANNSTHHVDVSDDLSTLIPPPERVAFKWNPKRALAFVLYGGCYQGIACHMFYNILFLKLFGPNRVFTKVAVSQFIMAPLLTLPCAYVFKGLVFGKSATAVLSDYWTGITQRGLLLSFWKLWIPIQFLIFAVIPVHLRIPFSSFFSFLWTVILSRKSNHA